jgi:hypothetical protein
MLERDLNKVSTREISAYSISVANGDNIAQGSVVFCLVFGADHRPVITWLTSATMLCISSLADASTEKG